MAKEKKKKKLFVSKQEKEQKKSTRVVIFVAVLTAIGFFPLFMTFFIGMLPTIAVLLTDKNPGKYKSKTVGFLNFVGTFHMITPLLKYEGFQTIDHAINISTDIWVLIFPLGLSLLGLLLVTFIPIVVSFYLSKLQVSKEKKMLEERTKLIRAWGEEVNKNAPPIVTIEQLRMQAMTKKKPIRSQNYEQNNRRPISK